MEKPLFWHQGLFLQPQHLQLKDIYDQSILAPYHTHIKPHLNGVVQLGISESALANYSFQVDKGAFWFSDMTYAVLGENAVIESRLFNALWKDGGKPLEVHLGLKKVETTCANVKEITSGDSLIPINTRFVCYKDAEDVQDIYQGGNPAPIKRMFYLLKIFFQNELDNLDGYDLIPIAVIERTGQTVHRSKEYVPPCVTLSASDILSGMVAELSNRLAFRGHELELLKNKRGIHNAEFGSRDMVYILALRSLNRYIPFFHHLKEDRIVHPFDVYTVIRQLVGELSAFSDTITVLGVDDDKNQLLPPYNHEKLRECFSRASVLISRLIDEITSGPEYMMELVFDDFCYGGVMKPEYFQGNNHYYLVLRTNAEAKQVLDAIDISVKISSVGYLPSLLERALPGVQVEYLPVTPQELPRHKNAVYFKIDQHSENWSRIENDKTLGVHWDSAPDDLKIELMIVRRR